MLPLSFNGLGSSWCEPQLGREWGQRFLLLFQIALNCWGISSSSFPSGSPWSQVQLIWEGDRFLLPRPCLGEKRCFLWAADITVPACSTLKVVGLNHAWWVPISVTSRIFNRISDISSSCLGKRGLSLLSLGVRALSEFGLEPFWVPLLMWGITFDPRQWRGKKRHSQFPCQSLFSYSSTGKLDKMCIGYKFVQGVMGKNCMCSFHHFYSDCLHGCRGNLVLDWTVTYLFSCAPDRRRNFNGTSSYMYSSLLHSHGVWSHIIFL